VSAPTNQGSGLGLGFPSFPRAFRSTRAHGKLIFWTPTASPQMWTHPHHEQYRKLFLSQKQQASERLHTALARSGLGGGGGGSNGDETSSDDDDDDEPREPPLLLGRPPRAPSAGGGGPACEVSKGPFQTPVELQGAY
jgi:hypothetical protein